jgi:cell division protein ZipA
MKIFHHYGIGEIKVKKPVFSIANMLEPGTFDVQRISKFVSPGLVLFMRLPGPFGGRVAFELMLNNAQKIAEILEGILEDDKHQPMTPQTINLLRERIANFERRDTPLSLRKRFS